MVVRPLAERHMGGNGAGKIFVGDTLEPVFDVLADGIARIDPVTRNPDIHKFLLPNNAQLGMAPPSVNRRGCAP